MTRLWAATGDAVARIDDGDVVLSLEGSGAQCVAADPRDPDTAWAGLRAHGLRWTTDGGASWRDADLPEPGVFSVAVSPADGAVYAGTEPSRVFVAEGGDRRWRELEALQAIPSRPQWSFPPRPWTSHVRWIAPSPHDGGLLLVGIELGGLMRSTDGGASFADHRPGAVRDVHSLAWHPSARDRAYEAGGAGAAFSVDGGDTWTPADEGRDRDYVWAVTVDPADPDRWYVTASTGPRAAHEGGDAQARLYRRAGSGPWEQLAAFATMPYALAFAGGRLHVGLADGRVLAGEEELEEVARVPRVHALAAAP